MLLSWAAFHASQVQSNVISLEDISCLLPLFREEAKSVAMMKHAMGVITQSVNFLNPNQIPVMEADQPLYTLAKQIQWNCPEIYGEDKYMEKIVG